MEKSILSYNLSGRTYLLKKLTLRECMELRLGDQIFKNQQISYDSRFVIGVVSELTPYGFKFIERDCDINSYEVDLREEVFLSKENTIYTSICRVLREEINPISMNGYLGLYNLLDKTYPMREDLIVDSTLSREYDGKIIEDVFDFFIDNRCYTIITKKGNDIQSREELFEDIIVKMCSKQYISYDDETILHKSKLTEKKELIDKYIRQVESDYLNNLPY